MKLYSYPVWGVVSQGNHLRIAKASSEVRAGLLTYLFALPRACEATLRTIKNLTEAYTCVIGRFVGRSELEDVRMTAHSRPTV
jgi:hypothetical protein